MTPATSVRGIVREAHPGWGRPLAWAHSAPGRLLLFVPPLLILILLELRASSWLDLGPLRAYARRHRRSGQPADDVTRGGADAPDPV